MPDLISPTSQRPGIIPVYFSRSDLQRLIDILKNSKGDDLVLRNQIARDLFICISEDLEAIKNTGHPRYNEYINLYNKLAKILEYKNYDCEQFDE